MTGQGGGPFQGIQAITLDLDDTLWPVLPVLAQAERELVEWLAPRAPLTAQTLAAGRSVLALKSQYPEHAHDMSWLRRRLLHDLLTELHEDPALADPAFAVFLEARQRVTPWPEVEGILASWASRYRIAAITNGNADVHRTPLGPYFSASISAPAFGAAKPDPRIFHAACDALGVEPEATLHIGDDLELDVLAARRAGLHAAWLLGPELGRPSVVNNTERRGALQPYFFSLLSIDNAVQR